MDKIKNFIKKKKLDKKFKEAGQGYMLHDAPQQSTHKTKTPPQTPQRNEPKNPAPTRPDVSAIAEAAEKRMMAKMQSGQELTSTQKMVRMQAQKELEREQRKLAEQMDKVRTEDVEVAPMFKTQSTILYTCELFDEDLALPKSQMLTTIEHCLFEQLTDCDADPISTSIYIIYTLNKSDISKSAVETILKYLQNIISNPEEVKFRRIRQSNKIFQEKVARCKGALNFLKAIGFREEQQPINERSETIDVETFWVLSQLNMDSLVQKQKELAEGKSIPIRVFRDRKVFVLDSQAHLPSPEIPEDFFMHTPEDIRREQQKRAEALEKITMLRTQKMRENDAAKEKLPVYKYTYIRIRFPDNYVLQGIFSVFEKIIDVRKFVAKNLALEHGVFTLIHPQSSPHQSYSEENTLVELGLAPAAILFFKWDVGTTNHLRQQGEAISFLKKELMDSANLLH